MGADTATKPKPDRSGWATYNDTLCSDGRTIKKDAFKHQDQVEVPMVYMHDHNSIENVLGHVLLTNKPEGVWADLYFNETPSGQHAKAAVEHGDLNSLSIWAHELKEQAKQVWHGMIREVSLVLAGANPMAKIVPLTMQHGDSEVAIDGEAFILTGLTLGHAEGEEPPAKADDAEEEDQVIDPKKVYDEMSDEQKQVVHFFVGATATDGKLTEPDPANPDPTVEHGTLNNDPAGTGKEGKPNMDPNDPNNVVKHNVFEADGKTLKGGTLVHSATGSVFEQKTSALTSLAHDGMGGDAPSKVFKIPADDVKGIIKHAMQGAGIKNAVAAYVDANRDVLKHGIENLEVLFPEARALTQYPSWDKRRTEWAATVLNGVNKVPFAKLKTWTADLTFEEARAKGYITGNVKKEQFFAIAKRETSPTTFYQKQKFDRDDILDITDFDLIAWVKIAMRVTLEEEFARAILIGDGRAIDDDDKIREDKIRPIAKDDPYYTEVVTVDNADPLNLVEQMALAREGYRGKGQPSFFTTRRWLARALTRRNSDEVKLWKNKSELAADMDVSDIIVVDVMAEAAYVDIIGILVNLSDYAVGTDRGGEVTLFDDFDIDVNQYKYLMEGRSSGALTEPKTAQVFKVQAGAAVTATAPTIDRDTYIFTVPAVTGVTYKDQDGNTLASGAHQMDEGDVVRIIAHPNSGKFLVNGRREWSFLRPTGSTIVEA